MDDDLGAREALAEMLSGLGYPVETAEDGAQALARVERRVPRLVLLDLKMPVMSGHELLKRLRSSPATAEVPVLILSAFGFEWEAELLGAQGYVSKPIDPGALKQRVAQFAGRPKRRQTGDR